MYYRRRNRITALLFSVLGVALIAFSLPNVSVGVILLTAVVLYGIGKFAGAWIGRCRYWYNRGTKGQKTWKCQSCNRRRWRTAKDGIPRCHTCGWKPGLPVVRWFQYSVPARQFKRTLAGSRVLLFGVVIIAVVVVAGAIGTGIPAIDTVGDDVEAGLAGVLDDGGGSGSNNPAVQQGMNRTVVEQHFIQYLNEEREKRELQPVSQRQVLTEMGENHSQVMAREGEIGHVEPDGDTIKDRYESRGLLPECRLPIEGSDQYYAGAENAAATWIHRDVQTDDGTTYIDSERGLAKRLVEQWMNSPPHRKAMLVSSADEGGLGLYITDDNKVYASLELC